MLKNAPATAGGDIEREVAETEEERLRRRFGCEAFQFGLGERGVCEEQRGDVEQLVDALVDVEEFRSLHAGTGGKRGRNAH